MSLTFVMNGKPVSCSPGATLLDAARENKQRIPTLCHLNGLTEVGACRLCLVEVAGSNKLLPACTTLAQEGMQVTSDSDRLRAYRKQIIELLFSERNHVCAVCVADGHCDLQDLSREVGMNHVRYDFLHPPEAVDLSHDRFGLDQNRCILCTRCVRACDELEGAHVWDISGRGIQSHVITGLNEPWGSVEACTSCGKCVMACPTGALFPLGISVAERARDRGTLSQLKHARGTHEWIHPLP